MLEDIEDGCMFVYEVDTVTTVVYIAMVYLTSDYSKCSSFLHVQQQSLFCGVSNLLYAKRVYKIRRLESMHPVSKDNHTERIHVFLSGGDIFFRDTHFCHGE